ncbi:hypothetical protein [Amycolatopsis jejuensis]|uniref:hypothetical protein n=1 Tax=Amycolatopsis jejuensis TaxID=330084 RepID=UPI001FE1E9A9|nr:hypothetical protein [Amycolatopsis jejuensis]
MTVTEDAGVRGIVVACAAAADLPARLGDVPLVHAGARPGKAEIDLLLGEYDRLVVLGTDGDLAAVVVRLMRREALPGVSVGFVPTEPGSRVGPAWRLPADPDEAFALAWKGDDVAVPLVRDDSGGVLLAHARLRDVKGQAYCDEQVAFDGSVTGVEVTPDDTGVAARVTRGRFLKRSSTYRGRAFQIGCVPTSSLVIDGVPHPRPVTRWTWYRHLTDLRAVRG